MALTLMACACGSGQRSATQSTEPVRAVASVFSLAWIASQIAPHADLTVLGQQGQEPHDLELSPGDREAIETADVVLYMGDIHFQPQVEEAVASTEGEVLSVASVVGDAALPSGSAHAHEGKGAGIQQAEPETTIDPHVWF